MTRARLVALMVLACALAAAATGSGPYLIADRKAPPFVLPGRRERLTRYRPAQPLIDSPAIRRIAHVTELALQGLVVAIALAVLAFGLYRLWRVLVRLTGLRLARSRGGVATEEYDDGDYDDSEGTTALRKRVRDELALLSADLDADVEPREAVIACYVRMEKAFAEAGSGRGVTETPMELVARVLTEQRVPEPDVRRLTELFTEARFSRHPVTGDMRDAARRSLRNVAASLGAAA